MDIKLIVSDFTRKLTDLIERDAVERAQTAVLGAFGIRRPRGPGRPPRVAALVVSVTKRGGKKIPPQFCPVPGCKNKAAPIFGMVCAKHKNVSKAKIKEYREARKARKLGLK